MLPRLTITDEIADEAAEHQLFFTGTAVHGPGTNNPGAPLLHTYTDMDENGLPIGLANQIVASTGELVVTLRHMPALNGVAVKTAQAAETVKTSGTSSLGGSTDVAVTFTVTVQ